MDLVKALTSLEQSVTLWCMNTNAEDDQDIARFTKLLAERDRISSTIQQLELMRAQWAARDLTGPTQDLNRLTSEIQDTQRDISHARDIMDNVTAALDIASKVALALRV